MVYIDIERIKIYLKGRFYMTLFDSFTRKVTDKARAAARKSSELVEATKLKMSISVEEDKIEKLYGEIGKAVYESYCAGKEVSDEVRELCDRIEAHFAAIEDMKKKIMELSRIKKCPACGAEIDLDVAFCPRCGEKQPEPEPEPEPEETREEQGPKVCASCGTENFPGSNFCRECGAKL